MSAPLRLEPLGPEAAPALHALHAPLFDPPWTTESLAGQIAQPESSAIAGLYAEELAGFVLFRTVLDEAEILILAVAPEHQRRGIGRTLLHAALGLAKARGAHAMWLEVAVDNAPALALYDSAGFSPSGRRPRYYQRRAGGPVDALLLRRTLAPVTA